MREYRRNDSESALRSGNVLCLLSLYIGETCNLLLAWSFQAEAFTKLFPLLRINLRLSKLNLKRRHFFAKTFSSNVAEINSQSEYKFSPKLKTY